MVSQIARQCQPGSQRPPMKIGRAQYVLAYFKILLIDETGLDLRNLVFHGLLVGIEQITVKPGVEGRQPQFKFHTADIQWPEFQQGVFIFPFQFKLPARVGGMAGVVDDIAMGQVFSVDAMGFLIAAMGDLDAVHGAGKFPLLQGIALAGAGFSTQWRLFIDHDLDDIGDDLIVRRFYSQ